MNNRRHIVLHQKPTMKKRPVPPLWLPLLLFLSTLSLWRTSFEVCVEKEVVSPDEAISSATGHVFRGNRTRTFTGARKFQNWTPSGGRLAPMEPSCTHWVVVTTIYEPSEAVRRAAHWEDWCTVVIADVTTPVDYHIANASHMVFLPVSEQSTALTIPTRHFSRKNLGYLYAIQRGAEVILDLDDDNVLHEAPTVPEGDWKSLRSEDGVINHHPRLGLKDSWPRGYPLELLQHASPLLEESVAEPGTIGVYQMCANQNPDVDAIHRFVRPLPIDFEDSTTPFVVRDSFVPTNAQATLHTALWATLLPKTVPGRVSDIWRGYFAQALFPYVGTSVAIVPPGNVVQDRNEHNILGDLQAEWQLYHQVGTLIKYLRAPRVVRSIPQGMEDLWIDLYEREYIELDDVWLVQEWIQALDAMGYEFPEVVGLM